MSPGPCLFAARQINILLGRVGSQDNDLLGNRSRLLYKSVSIVSDTFPHCLSAYDLERPQTRRFWSSRWLETKNKDLPSRSLNSQVYLRLDVTLFIESTKEGPG